MDSIRAALTLALMGAAELALAQAPVLAPPTTSPAPTSAHGSLVITDRTKYLNLYPCSQCHDLIKPDAYTGDRPWSHEEQTFAHPKGQSCTLCHVKEQMDSLRLITGERVSFARVQDVCRQCHGERGRDFDLGIHGKQVGAWNEAAGAKYRYSCTDCHNPHNPRYHERTVLPPPARPKLGIPKEGEP